MSELEKENDVNSWKKILRLNLIKGLIGDPSEKASAQREVGYYYHCQAPASLYKYYKDTELNFESIKTSKMWFSAPYNFNDVFDCSITVDERKIFENSLKMYQGQRRVREGSVAWRDLKKEIHQESLKLHDTFEALRKQMGVACFSESYESLLMWSHYADNHRGLCVEYDLMKISRQLNFSPIPVIYSDDRACFCNLDIKRDKQEVIKVFIESLTSKSSEWSYEKEWRIVQDQKACGDKWDPEKKGALLDMISPTSITLGCEVRPEFEKKIHELCQANKIDLYKMEKDLSYYRLNRKNILKF